MKILYLGGVYYAELSLFKESQANPELSVVFANTGEGMDGVYAVVPTRVGATADDFNKIRQEVQPDLTIIRNWSNLDHAVFPGCLYWHQEVVATHDDGHRPADPSACLLSLKPEDLAVAYTSPHLALAQHQLWLPYCVSRAWADQQVVRDIPVMVSTNIPPAEYGGDMKVRSLDILVKPVVKHDPALVHVFTRNPDGYELVPYIRPCLRPPYSPLTSAAMLSRAKIYISPTTIWHDPGIVSHKVFEAMACRCLVLTNEYPGMVDMFGPDGQNLIYANTPQEALDKVRYYLDHEQERQAVADRGFEFVHATYNWQSHLSRVFNELRSR